MTSTGMVLLVNEAHTLPLRLLDEIRLLTNLARNGQPLVRVVLAGAPVLEERLANPKLDSLSQRLSARCYLEALNCTETQAYIHSQINWAGGRGPEVFPEAACQSVFRATGGVTRLISQVCDHALLLIYVAGRRSVTPADIEEAWADLQQLPVPTTAGTTANGGSAAVIEFGSLDDSEEPTANRRSDSTAAPAVFRVASLDHAGELGEPEPAGQIHRIERLLAQADEGFQPAGSIGPDVPLQLDRCQHPFQEAFEQEEIITDRYQAAQGNRPTLCAEGGQCNCHTACAEVGQCNCHTPCAEGPLPVACACRQETPPATMPATLPTSDESSRQIPCAEGAPHTMCAGHTDSSPLTPSQEAEPCATTPIARPPSGKPVVYRRLFATLRRG